MAASDHVDLETFMTGVKRRNPGQAEFVQAVQEVAQDVFDFINDKEPYHEYQILRRIAEPDRVISFRVCWEDDRGNIRVQRGWRVQNNNAIGPYKGGIRFHPSVTESVLKFLAFEQTFKNSLTGLPMGGAKGGANFNPRGKSDHEVMRFCQSFMTELYRHVGADVDVPAGDIGVGAREIGYMFGQYKRITNHFTGVLTGKGLEFGGSLIRTEATGYGAVYFLQNMLQHARQQPRRQARRHLGLGQRRDTMRPRRSANSAARSLTLSDSEGFIHDPDGIDQDKLDWVKDAEDGQDAAASREYAEVSAAATSMPARRRGACPAMWRCRAPPRTSSTGADAKTLIGNGCMAVAEGANMPTTLEGVHVFQDAQAPVRAGQGGQRRRRRRLRPGDEPELRAHFLEGRSSYRPC